MVEGLRDKTNAELDEYVDFCANAIKSITEGGKEGNFQLKLTAYMSTELMEKLNIG